MLRRIAVIAASAATLACGALPASAAASPIHTFGIPGVYGVRAWGSYQHTGTKVRVAVCVKDVARDVYGAAAAGLAFDSGYRHHDDASATPFTVSPLPCVRAITSSNKPLSGGWLGETTTSLKCASRLSVVRWRVISVGSGVGRFQTTWTVLRAGAPGTKRRRR